MQLAANIAAITNYGVERYECYKKGNKVGFIDICKMDDYYRAYVQIGIPNSGLIISWFDGRTKRIAVKQAFEKIYNHFWTEKGEFLKDVCCPNILKGASFNFRHSSKINPTQQLPQQLELFN